MYIDKDKNSREKEKKNKQSNSKDKLKPIRLVISATFTSEPIKDYIEWWGEQFGYDIEVKFADYNQVFQELANEHSLISTNEGLNLILVRFEDWVRSISDLSDIKKIGKLEEFYDELIELFEARLKPIPYFVGIFPVSTHLSLSDDLLEYMEETYTRWQEDMEQMENVYIIDFTPLKERYNCEKVFDPLSDSEGHLPFTGEYYAAIGATTARQICGYMENNFKENTGEMLNSNQLLPMEQYNARDLQELLIEKEIDETVAIVEEEAPGNETQRKLVEVWEKTLRRRVTGINSSFFNLGGDSLKVVTLIAEIHKTFSAELSMNHIFDNKTIKEQAQLVEGSEKTMYIEIEPVGKQGNYPLSSAQMRLYILNQMEPDSVNYNIPKMYQLEVEPDRIRLKQAFQKLIDKHETFRTSIEMSENQPVQKIHEHIDFEIQYYDARHCSIEDETEINSIMKDFIRPFDLSRVPLIRAGLLEAAQKKFFLMVDMHHIISDGISYEIFKKELIDFYELKQLPPLNIQYKDFSVWEKKENRREKLKQQETYWVEVFGGDLPVLNLPVDYIRPPIQSFEGDTIFFALEKPIIDQLKETAKKEGATLFMMLWAIFNTLMMKLSGQEDIIVGTPVGGRTHPDLENIIGMFVNTLAMRSYPQREKTFLHFLAEIKKVTLEAFENQEYPFEELVDVLKLERDASRNPLFDVVFVLQNMEAKDVDKHTLKMKPYNYRRTTSKFDMALFAEEVDETEQGLPFELEYSTKLFKEETILRFINYFNNIISDVLKNPAKKLAEIEIISTEEKEQILYDFNRTEAGYPENNTIHQLFEAQAEKTPGNIALYHQGNRLTYREFNEKVNQLAHHLRERGIGPNSIVGIMIEPGLEMVVAVMAVLKAGGAYLPIPLEDSPDHIHFLIKNSQCHSLLTREKYIETMDFAVEVVRLEDKSLYRASKGNPDPVNTPKDLACIIYSSNNTGQPKGVMMEHGSIINTLWTLQQKYPGKEPGVYLFKTPYQFDVSIAELFGWFFGGGSLVISEPDGLNCQVKILEIVREQKITHIHFAPTLFNQFTTLLKPGNVSGLVSLEYIFLSGEMVLPEVINRFKQLMPGLAVEILYGSPEVSVFAAAYSLSGWDGLGSIPIGTPLNNTKIYILDFSSQEPVPAAVGIPGELCVSGIGLARGYLKETGMTDEDFVDNPFAKSEEKAYKKLFRTGDLARWLPDGNLQYLGPMDRQVKIRGARIERSEIENRLLKQDNIKEAVVVSRGGKNRPVDTYFCTYVTSDETLDTALVRDALSNSLPAYMIPSYIVKLGRIPITQDGKFDREELLDLKRDPYQVEEIVLEIIAEELHRDKADISLDDNFFQLGGHSYKAAQGIISRLQETLKLNISMVELFKRPTLRQFSKFLTEGFEVKYASIQPVESCEYYPQSSAQKRLYFLHQLEEENTAYNIQMMDIYCKGIEKQKLEEALCKLIKRHESLRTSFHIINGKPLQKIHDFNEICRDFEVEYYETTGDGPIYIPGPANDDNDSTRVINKFIRPFDLSKAPLLRVGFIKLGNIKVLIIDMHHIIADGISREILLKELWDLYDGEELPGLRIQYKDFSHWFNQKDQRKKLVEEQEIFWMKEFEGEIPLINLPVDYPRPAKLTFDGDTVPFEFDMEETQQLYRLAQEQSQSLYMILFAVYNVLLAKITGQEEIIIGTVTAGRIHYDLRQIVGMFVNTLALRNFPSGGKTFEDFLMKEVRINVYAALENQDYPFDELVKKVAPRQDASRNPLIDVVFGLESTEDPNNYLMEVTRPDKSNDFGTKKAKFDITLVCFETGKEIECSLEYKTKIFKRNTIERFASHFKRIVSTVCGNIQQRIAAIEFISVLEKSEILYIFNDTESEYPKNKTIHELFRDQVDNTPDNIAVVGASFAASVNDQPLTYRQLNARANQMAASLRNKGIKPDDLAAIMVEPSQEMIIGLLGILKAGATFLPIKDGTPIDRIKYILEESGSRFLLTRKVLLEGFTFPGEILSLDDPTLYKGDEKDLDCVKRPGDMAYVIYTSGSTGKPKGVMVEHCSLVNLCFWHNKYYSVTSKDHATKFAGFGFDASVWEVFPYLVIGAALYIVPEEIKLDIQKLNRYFEENGITISFLPTQMCEQFMNIDNTSLRALLTGGDKLRTFIRKRYQLYNNYGPTENTVVTTSCPVNEFLSNIPIGKPLYNNQIYILDKSDHMQPIGVPGELCISGDSLARGYLNNPELTQEKFIESPFKHLTPWAQYPKVYRTGDLARWLADGNIEFLGRIDYQVKIRGFRIELGEIENQLLHIENIKEAVVIAREDTPEQKYLCAYIVSSKSGEVDIPSLKEMLSRNLPDYMIPSFFVQIQSIPLTANGKIDNKALPAPETTLEEYAAPTNETEAILAGIWSEVLGIEKISIDGNFFDIGGDSIKTILISSRLRKHQLIINVSDFFLYPTIRRLAKHVKKMERIIHQETVTGKVNLTPIQQWFFKNHLSYGSHFNQSVLLYRKKRFNEEIIKKVFTKIVEHHDALRMVYAFEKDAEVENIVQQNREIDDKLFSLEVRHIEIEKDEKTAIKRESLRLQKSIDLKNGPLVKLGLFKGLEGDYLSVIIHHLVVDGISWRILLEDFEIGYQQGLENKEISFQDKTDSFQHWAQKLSEYAGSKKLLKELTYWKEIDEITAERLPVDHESDSEQEKFKYHVFVPMVLPREKTEQLMKNVNWAYNTEVNDILLTAVGLTVKEWTGTNKVSINLEGHGREEIIEDVDISRTVGWFTTQYPVILDIEKADDLAFSIKNVKETLRRIPNKGIGHGILKFLTPPEKKESLKFKQTPEIVFNYLGEFGEESYAVIDKISGITDLNIQDNISPDFRFDHKIDIEGVTTEGKLNLYFFYNKHQYERNTIENFAKIFKTQLIKIIDHCQEKEQRELAPSDLGYTHLTLEELEQITSEIKVNIDEDMEIQLIYPLSPMQSGMLYHSIKDKESTAYFEQNVIRLYGDVEPSILESSLNQLIERYDILRTIFVYNQLVEPLQIVLKHRKARLYYYEDISHLNEKQQEKYLNEFRKKDQKRSFDITRDLLIRFSLFKTGMNKYILVLSFHHILMDGWCLGIIFEELRQIYLSSVSGDSLQLEPVIPYLNYIKWLEKQDQDEGLSYWGKYLADYEEAAILPKFGKAVKEGEYKHDEYHYALEEELLSRVNKLASDQQVTLNTVCQTIWGILIQRYNNSNDVVFGSIVSGRPSEIEGVERMVGLFINMIPVRIKSMEEQKFSKILRQVQEDSLNSRKHEYLPVAEIQSKTSLKGDLIDHIMIYENYPVQEELEKSTMGQGFIVEGMKIYEHTNYDFNVIVIPWKGLDINFSYNALVYERDIVVNIAFHFEKIFRQVAENPEIYIRDLHITTEEEKKQLLFNFNDSKVDYPKDNTIHELFEIQAGKTPDMIAAVFKDRQLGYRELHERTNQLAHLLREKGVKPDTLSGIMVNRSMEMMVALLGVLKAGGAYVPIDPEYPVDRVEYMIKDSSANFLLTQQEVMNKFEESGFDARVIDLFDVNVYSSGTNRDNLDHITSPHHLAYVIYTSGSTGKPKGVTIRHRNAVNFFKGMIDRIDFSPGKTILAVTTLCFDIFLLETLLPVTIGLKLAIADEEQQRDPEGLWEVIATNRVDLVQLTPSRLKLLLSHSDISYLQKIEDILVGGEAFPRNLFEELKAKYLGNIIDVYGPTETTVWSTTRDLTGQDEINIGTPIANTQIYILDKYKRIQPVGVIGELYIGGDGVSRGYLNRPELTSERFVENPYDALEKLDKPYKEIYNTGDLARWLPDGNIDFLGRVDHQVKIRGFRIETGEIEAQILKREEVKEAVVIARDDPGGEKFLCAYIVPDHDAIEPGQELSVSALRDYLLQELPDYMVPSYFIIIDRIPLTPNGKVDRKSLVAEGEFLQTGIKYMPPRNEVEEQLIELWQKILKVKEIGINNNFFELGGNSLKAIQLVSLMVKNFDVKISHIFQYRTVADLAANVLFNKDNIKEKIQEMKRELHPTPEKEKRRNQLQSKLEEEKQAYIERIEQEQFDDLNLKKDYKNILLTGATGYLGAHLVPELLENTEAVLYFLVRGVTHEDAQERLKNKLTFYFGENFFDNHLNRFKIIRGDLKEDNLGLDEKTYESLTMEVDSVIHSAANVRHIGQYEEFYEDNVAATQRMLEYAAAGKKKDFHFISTLGVCSGKPEGKEYVLYNEYSPDIGQQHENVYARSKFEAEKLVIAFRQKGLNTSIYRVGILVSHSETGKFQENIEENAFYYNLKAFLSLGIVSEDYYPAEFSFIDYTARAIALLISRKNLKNEIFHLKNHHLLNWMQMGIFLEDVGIDINVVSQDQFLDYLSENIEHDKSREEMNRFLLNSGFFASMETEHKYIISGVESSRTVKILKQLDFEWPKVNQQHIEKMIAYGRALAFF
jgi:amino acid adenylation domain-containing protein/thioester reductase-like protein/non-ribosomal peptide synthase protein (TIGR01720 family)